MAPLPRRWRWLSLSLAGALLAGCVSGSAERSGRTDPAESRSAFGPGVRQVSAPGEGTESGGVSVSAGSSIITIGTTDSADFHSDVRFTKGPRGAHAHADLWVRGLPPGVDAWFVRDPLSHAGRTVLRVRTAGAAHPGTYLLTVGATAGTATGSLRVPLVVTARPGFRLRSVPSVQTVAPATRGTFRLLVEPINGFRGPVRWEVAEAPADVRARVRPLGPTTFELHLRTTARTRPGTRVVRLRATGGDARAATTVALRVVGTASSWRTGDVGSTGNVQNNTVRVGNARNDGVRRVYVGTVTDGRVYEFTRTRSGWRRRLVGSSSGGREIHNMTIGPGRGDGRNRIYACSMDGHLYEFTRRPSGWARQTVGARTDGCFHAVVGPGRGGTRNRLYAARDNEVWEYTWTASGWRALRVGQVAPDSSRVIAHGVEMGKGRGDGRMRLYVASDAAGTFEATHTANGWRMRPMGDTGDVRNVSVGPGRGDGRRRVYAGVLDGGEGYIREFTWSDGDWVIRSIGATDPIRGAMVHAYVINGRNDGRRRVYGAGGDGYVYEFTRTRSGWRRRLVGGSGQYMYGFHFGKRARSNRIRLYGADFGGDVFEFTWR